MADELPATPHFLPDIDDYEVNNANDDYEINKIYTYQGDKALACQKGVSRLG